MNIFPTLLLTLIMSSFVSSYIAHASPSPTRSPSLDIESPLTIMDLPVDILHAIANLIAFQKDRRNFQLIFRLTDIKDRPTSESNENFRLAYREYKYAKEVAYGHLHFEDGVLHYPCHWAKEVLNLQGVYNPLTARHVVIRELLINQNGNFLTDLSQLNWASVETVSVNPHGTDDNLNLDNVPWHLLTSLRHIRVLDIGQGQRDSLKTRLKLSKETVHNLMKQLGNLETLELCGTFENDVELLVAACQMGVRTLNLEHADIEFGKVSGETCALNEKLVEVNLPHKERHSVSSTNFLRRIVSGPAVKQLRRLSLNGAVMNDLGEVDTSKLLHLTSLKVQWSTEQLWPQTLAFLKKASRLEELVLYIPVGDYKLAHLLTRMKRLKRLSVFELRHTRFFEMFISALQTENQIEELSWYEVFPGAFRFEEFDYGKLRNLKRLALRGVSDSAAKFMKHMSDLTYLKLDCDFDGGVVDALSALRNLEVVTVDLGRFTQVQKAILMRHLNQLPRLKQITFLVSGPVLEKKLKVEFVTGDAPRLLADFRLLGAKEGEIVFKTRRAI